MSAGNLEAVKKHCGDDLDASRFSILLAVLSDAVSSGVSEKMKDVVSSTLAFTSNCNIFSEVRKLLQLMYVLPVTAASAKHCFSFIGHLKMLPPKDHECAPQRLNHLMILSVHRKCTESLNVQQMQ